ncbi:zinc finger protein 239-like [Anopheles albimanus]|uniref:zinc finger protein 239-like n=1 Tax=Anopheles albimanus TaxID=7167 RepID=UPI001640BE68|nr:zinc finger protein 239-like [Anopheles albimanus]
MFPAYEWPLLDAEAEEPDVCLLSALISVHDSVIAKEVTFESEYLPPLEEPPFADFALIDPLLPSGTGTPTRPPLRNVPQKDLRQPDCTECGCRFQCKSHQDRHQSLHHGNDSNCTSGRPLKSRCRLCREQLPTVLHLADHLRTVHPLEAVCDVCLATFHNSTALVCHRRYHFTDDGGRYVCDVCQKPCVSSSHLHLHRKTHLDEKPYSCGHCPRHFSSSGNRQKHVARVHTHERRYRCMVCAEAFIYPRQLKLHLQREHPDSKGSHSLGSSEQRSFECRECGKCFKQTTHLRNHLLTHTGIRAHGCEFCAKRFALAGDLRIHRRIHTQEKPFRCDQCPAAFIMGKQLNKHRQAVHNVRKA